MIQSTERDECKEVGYMAESRKIDIISLKQFAKKELRQYALTYEFLLGEPDMIPVEEFVTKVRVWLQLLEKDIEMKSG
jgi:hypothetical protein